jgi:hypothetical protein
MSKLVKTSRMLAAVAFWGCTVALHAHAEPVDQRELGRWVPSFALIGGLGAQRVQGSLGTSDVIGDPVTAPLPPNPPQPIVPGTPQTGRSRMMTPWVGISAELMTPSWTPLVGDPRLFGHADVGYALGPAYNLPNIGNPGPFATAPQVTSIVTAAITGQGGRTTMEVGGLWVTAGAGIAFTFEVKERAIRIKPSVEYLREELEISGLVRRAVAPPSGNSPNLSDFRAITLATDATRVYHGIGPGIDLELDTRRTGPFVLSVFLSAKAWNFPDNTEKTFTSVNEYGEQAVFSVLKNDWAFAGALGLRFRWVPE